MARKPRALDLFCGAGGASMGLHLAGFEVVGVDIKPQPHYPLEFHQADALTFPLEGYDLIWASPPCQGYTRLRSVHKDRIYADLIEPTRQRLEAWGGPYIIENVPGAPLRSPVLLCGKMFGLKVYRHRLFELNYFTLAPPHEKHYDRMPRGGRGNISPKGYVTVTGHYTNGPYCRAAMGIDWMAREAVAQAIPPAYSEFLGRKFIQEQINVSTLLSGVGGSTEGGGCIYRPTTGDAGRQP